MEMWTGRKVCAFKWSYLYCEYFPSSLGVVELETSREILVRVKFLGFFSRTFWSKKSDVTGVDTSLSTVKTGYSKLIY